MHKSTTRNTTPHTTFTGDGSSINTCGIIHETTTGNIGMITIKQVYGTTITISRIIHKITIGNTASTTAIPVNGTTVACGVGICKCYVFNCHIFCLNQENSCLILGIDHMSLSINNNVGFGNDYSIGISYSFIPVIVFQFYCGTFGCVVDFIE